MKRFCAFVLALSFCSSSFALDRSVQSWFEIVCGFENNRNFSPATVIDRVAARVGAATISEKAGSFDQLKVKKQVDDMTLVWLQHAVLDMALANPVDFNESYEVLDALEGKGQKPEPVDLSNKTLIRLADIGASLCNSAKNKKWQSTCKEWQSIKVDVESFKLARMNDLRRAHLTRTCRSYSPQQAAAMPEKPGIISDQVSLERQINVTTTETSSVEFVNNTLAKMTIVEIDGQAASPATLMSLYNRMKKPGHYNLIVLENGEKKKVQINVSEPKAP